jgi:hypothetical protein
MKSCTLAFYWLSWWVRVTNALTRAGGLVMLQCPKCNHKNLQGSLFCAKCFCVLQPGPPDDLTDGLGENGGTYSLKGNWGTADLPGKSLVLRIRNVLEPLRLAPGREIWFGRADGTNGLLPDFDLGPFGAARKGVSRIHAALSCIANGTANFSVTDLGSSNGTFLNGERLVAHQPYALQDGDEICLGKMVLHVYFR